MYIHLCVHIYVYIQICIYIYVYVHIHSLKRATVNTMDSRPTLRVDIGFYAGTILWALCGLPEILTAPFMPTILPWYCEPRMDLGTSDVGDYLGGPLRPWQPSAVENGL